MYNLFKQALAGGGLKLPPAAQPTMPAELPKPPKPTGPGSMVRPDEPLGMLHKGLRTDATGNRINYLPMRKGQTASPASTNMPSLSWTPTVQDNRSSGTIADWALPTAPGVVGAGARYFANKRLGEGSAGLIQYGNDGQKHFNMAGIMPLLQKLLPYGAGLLGMHMLSKGLSNRGPQINIQQGQPIVPQGVAQTNRTLFPNSV